MALFHSKTRRHMINYSTLRKRHASQSFILFDLFHPRKSFILFVVCWFFFSKSHFTKSSFSNTFRVYTVWIQIRPDQTFSNAIRKRHYSRNAKSVFLFFYKCATLNIPSKWRPKNGAKNHFLTLFILNLYLMTMYFCYICRLCDL